MDSSRKYPTASVPGYAHPELYRIFPHDHPEVVLGLAEQAVGIDEREAAGGRLEHVPLVHVSVHQHRPLVVVSSDPPCSAAQRMLHRAS